MFQCDTHLDTPTPSSKVQSFHNVSINTHPIHIENTSIMDLKVVFVHM